jgi:hypothetical protein
MKNLNPIYLSEDFAKIGAALKQGFKNAGEEWAKTAKWNTRYLGVMGKKGARKLAASTKQKMSTLPYEAGKLVGKTKRYIRNIGNKAKETAK